MVLNITNEIRQKAQMMPRETCVKFDLNKSHFLKMVVVVFYFCI